MLEKLATHNVEDVSQLISLADKSARAVERWTWYSRSAQGTAAAGSSDQGRKRRLGRRVANQKARVVMLLLLLLLTTLGNTQVMA
jgi:hypothetical protein